MPKRFIVLAKFFTHLICLTPFCWLLHRYTSGALAQEADPINSITHFTGNWAIWILLASLTITPLRRISLKLAWMIGLRRVLGLYAFFYATLHLATYIFLFSGYDLPTALDGIRHGHPQAILEQWKQTWPTILDDVKKRRFIQVGFAAWCILLLLAATSPSFVSRTIGGTAWRRLHRFVYIAGLLAVVHYWWLVKTGVLTPWKDTVVLVVLLAARFIYSRYKKRQSYSSFTRATE